MEIASGPRVRLEGNEEVPVGRSSTGEPIADKVVGSDGSTTSTETPVVTAAALPIRFSQVLTNILDNALRYTPENGRVDISARKVDDHIEIAIQDSGEGVTPEEAAHLFDRFYRADESRTRDDGGSGLGLAIAKSIIEMHKGKIWAESERGKGLKVLIMLPLK